MGLGVLYMMLLVFLVFQVCMGEQLLSVTCSVPQTVEDVHFLLHKVDARLGKPLPFRSYAGECACLALVLTTSALKKIASCTHRITPNLVLRMWWYDRSSSTVSPSWTQDTINDEFIIAHLFGWFGKAFLLRDVRLCWIMRFWVAFVIDCVIDGVLYFDFLLVFSLSCLNLLSSTCCRTLQSVGGITYDVLLLLLRCCCCCCCMLQFVV